MTMDIKQIYDFSDRCAVVTGGAGVLCAEMCRALASLGAKVAIMDLNPANSEKLAHEIHENGGTALGIACNVLDKESVQAACDQVLAAYGKVDILINGAGGNKAQATTSAELPFFDLPQDALRWVFELNLLGTILPSQVFGKAMVDQGQGVILNISSMNAFRPLTRIPAYSAAKAGVSTFTQWLAVHLAPNQVAQLFVTHGLVSPKRHKVIQGSNPPREMFFKQIEHQRHGHAARAIRDQEQDAFAIQLQAGKRFLHHAFNSVIVEELILETQTDRHCSNSTKC